MLATGGAYDVAISAGGKPLRIKQGGHLNIELPLLAPGPMEYFVGGQDASGMVNWTATGQPLVPNVTLPPPQEPGFPNIPEGEPLTIIGIGMKGEATYFFEHTVIMQLDIAPVAIKWQASTPEAIKARLGGL